METRRCPFVIQPAGAIRGSVLFANLGPEVQGQRVKFSVTDGRPVSSENLSIEKV
jgi:hypothetical protein